MSANFAALPNAANAALAVPVPVDTAVNAADNAVSAGPNALAWAVVIRKVPFSRKWATDAAVAAVPVAVVLAASIVRASPISPIWGANGTNPVTLNA